MPKNGLDVCGGSPYIEPMNGARSATERTEMSTKIRPAGFTTLEGAKRWADGMEHRGRKCPGRVFMGEQIGTFLVVAHNEADAMAAAGYDAVR